MKELAKDAWKGMPQPRGATAFFLLLHTGIATYLGWEGGWSGAFAAISAFVLIMGLIILNGVTEGLSDAQSKYIEVLEEHLDAAREDSK